MTRDFGTHAVWSLIATGLFATSSFATITGSASLDGMQEVPPVATDASGTFLFEWDSAADTYTVTGTIAEIAPGDIVGVHIHDGAVGVNGPIVEHISNDGPTLSAAGSGTLLTLAGASVDAGFDYSDLTSGNYYLNIHTNDVPSGEIRGQISAVLVPEPSVGALAAGLLLSALAMRRR